MVFTEFRNGSAGVLTLSDGSLTASIAFRGLYATSNFEAQADSGAGTLLTFHG